MQVKQGLYGAAFALISLFSGCGEGLPERGYVEGTVKVEGVPLTKGQICFVPANGRPALGEIKKDGSFTLTTYQFGDGALVGLHKVTIEAVELVGGRSFSSFEEEVEASKSTARPTSVPIVKRLIQKNYSHVDSTDLTADVKSGSNRIDFNLKKPAPN